PMEHHDQRRRLLRLRQRVVPLQTVEGFDVLCLQREVRVRVVVVVRDLALRRRRARAEGGGGRQERDDRKDEQSFLQQNLSDGERGPALQGSREAARTPSDVRFVPYSSRNILIRSSSGGWVSNQRLMPPACRGDSIHRV